MILDGSGQAVTVSHHHHHHCTDALQPGSCSGRSSRRSCSALACGPLGVWILLLRRSYAAESLCARDAARPRDRRAGRASRCSSARPPACSSRRSGSRSWRARAAATSASPSSSPGCSGSAGSSRSRPRRRRAWASCCSATCSGSPTADLRRRGAALRRRAARARARPTARSRVAFDRGFARARRPGARRPRAARDARVTTVAAVQGLGNLLLVALILAPAAAALNLAPRLPSALALAAGLAALAGVAGLVVSYQLEIAAGASIALCAVALSVLLPS